MSEKTVEKSAFQIAYEGWTATLEQVSDYVTDKRLKIRNEAWFIYCDERDKVPPGTSKARHFKFCHVESKDAEPVHEDA